MTNATKMELFSERGTLARAQTISAEDLRDLSFYAFWRLFNVKGGKISRRDKEAIVAITGTGWPSHAAVTHQYHEHYARRILYAYMPCPALKGIEYVHEVVETYYGNSYAQALKDFVSEDNQWCPPWIQRNYEVKNGRADEEVNKKKDKTEKAEVKDSARSEHAKDGEDDNLADDPAAPEEPPAQVETDKVFPQAETYAEEKCALKFQFEEPEAPQDEKETARPESHATSYHWKDQNRSSEQKHSGKGPSYDNDEKLKTQQAILKNVKW